MKTPIRLISACLRGIFAVTMARMGAPIVTPSA